MWVRGECGRLFNLEHVEMIEMVQGREVWAICLDFGDDAPVTLMRADKAAVTKYHGRIVRAMIQAKNLIT